MHSDPFGMNNDAAKMEKMTKYIHPWRSIDAPPLQDELKLIVSDNFVDYNIGVIGMFVMDAAGDLKLKIA